MPDLCARFGFDRNRIEQRLAFLYLSKADHNLARRLIAEVIEPNLDTIVEKFYETLLFHPESRKLLMSGEVIERLKVTQRHYLLTLGKDFDTEAYFEERLRIGVTHAIIGLPLNVYQCAYANLICLISAAFPRSITERSKDYFDLHSFLIKITSLGIHITTSIGLASLATDDESETLLRRADMALYSAKDAGRNRVVVR